MNCNICNEYAIRAMYVFSKVNGTVKVCDACILHWVDDYYQMKQPWDKSLWTKGVTFKPKGSEEE